VGSSARAARVRGETHGVIEELSAGRRRDVYRTDVEFAPEAASYERDPRWGSSARWVARVGELYGAGVSQLEISNELGVSPGYISELVRRYGITKGVKK
jgi:hypothetical protein